MEFDGWKNHSTWNVALWINQEERYRDAAIEFMKDYKGKAPYKAFCADSGLSTQRTPDKIKWLEEGLDYKALNEMMWDMAPNDPR